MLDAGRKTVIGSAMVRKSRAVERGDNHGQNLFHLDRCSPTTSIQNSVPVAVPISMDELSRGRFPISKSPSLRSLDRFLNTRHGWRSEIMMIDKLCSEALCSHVSFLPPLSTGLRKASPDKLCSARIVQLLSQTRAWGWSCCSPPAV